MLLNGFLGIDVSKGYADFVLLDESKREIEESFQLDDSHAGRQRLRSLIEEWFSKGMKQLYCGVESTGGYENNWYSYLSNLSGHTSVYVSRLNARAVKAVSDASLKRTITDAVSAESIASYLISFPEKVVYAHPVEVASRFKDGRQHYSYIRMLQKQKVQLSNQLEKLLYQHFAEILVYCRNGLPGWLLRMLSRYPCAALVAKAGPAKLSAIKGISKEKAEAILGKLPKVLQVINAQTQHVITVTAKEILHKEELINQEQDYMVKMHGEDERVKLISSIKGIGVRSAVPIMLEIEDVTRFAMAKKMTAYFGVHPTFKQSGDGTWGSHMSKKGRREIRAILYMAALTGIRCNPILKTLYARFRAKGMKHYQAMGVVMHKLLRIIYGVLKNNTSFDCAIDEKNSSKTIDCQPKQSKKKEPNKYRYQDQTADAPISRRAAIKKKKQAASQTSE